MTKEEIHTALREIFGEVFFRDDLELTDSTTADDIEGWDSFRQVEIILATRDRFSIKFSNREVDSLKSVGDLVNLIESKISA